MNRHGLLTLLASLLIACGGGGGADTPPTPPPAAAADTALLFFGNSHTYGHDVPGLVAQLLRAADTTRSVAAVTGPGSMFLDDRLADAPSQALLAAQRWSAVVLQAQRYSSSGTVNYSIEEAKAWVRATRLAGALPILFPEWPRRGIDETARIFALHVSIAQAEPACVAPIPQAFDIALARDPGLVLHASDGNHSSPAGALLAAMVIASTQSGRAPSSFAPLSPSAVDAATQATLREAAATAVTQTSPWARCPNDRPRP